MAPRRHPARLFVELTTKCNLRCGMCVKQSGDGALEEGSMSARTFAALTPAFAHLESLVLNGIGEPLLHPLLEEFVARARAMMPERASIGFQTNGMLLTAERARALADAGLDRVCISVDAVSHESFRALRSGGELRGVEAAFANAAAANTGRTGRRLRLGFEFVLRRDNFAELPAAVRWAGEAGAVFGIVTQLLPYQMNLVPQAAYDTNTAGAIALLHAWKARAAREGLDIERYLEVFMKVARTEEEERIVTLVEQMKGEAASRGVALHLERLLRRDEGWFAAVDRVFDEARLAARDAGIELTLPELAPRNTRRCEFVEGDCVFVSWDGKVHPCYFLWHRYSCFVGGVEKKVEPWIVGDLADRDIVQTWNSPDARAFRERVLGYRFPFCHDCGFALCDYVAEAGFEQDCHLEQVPCGACLWCTGLFHCLQ